MKECTGLFDNINEHYSGVFAENVNEETVNDCWEMWKTNFLKITDKYVPFTIRRLKNRYKKALKSTDEKEKIMYWSEYKHKRNIVTKSIRKAKLDFYNSETSKCYNNPRKLWSHIRQAIPKQATNNVNNINADKFNEFFATVGQKVASRFDAKPEQYKNDLPQSIHQFKFEKVTEENIKKYLRRLSHTSKSDILGFDSKLLRLSIDIITPSLTILINASMTIGYLPSDWKLARVTPAYKGKGEFSNENNYRPLSVISHLQRLLSHVLINN
jgi:hypothetical protein